MPFLKPFLSLKTMTLVVPMYAVSFTAVLIENGGHVGAAAVAAVVVSASKFLVVHVHERYWR